MRTSETGPSWSDIAAWYDGLVEGGSGPHETAVDCLLGLVPSLGDADILDVACGQGLATRALADAGARRVVGVDASEAMLELARGHESPAKSNIVYVRDDAQWLTAFDDGTFDGVTCQLGLMDIPDLDATLAAIRRVLKQQGWFVFVIGHPCFLVPDAAPQQATNGRAGLFITGYFEERFWRSSNPNGVRRAGNHHRMLSTYLNALARQDLVIEAVDEPMAGSLLARQQPLYEQVPIFFGARARAGQPRRT